MSAKEHKSITTIPLSEAGKIEIDAPGYNVPCFHAVMDGEYLECLLACDGLRLGITIPKKGGRYWTLDSDKLQMTGHIDERKRA